MTYKHIEIPPHGERISVNEDSSLSPPAGGVDSL